MIKIAIIGTVGVPASYGGFETLVESLIEDTSAQFFVYCSGSHFDNRLEQYKSAKLVYIPFRANGVSSIIYDVLSIIHALFAGHKNFLILGVSGAIFLPILKLFPKIKIVTNIDGIEWRRDKWNGLAKVFLKFSECLAVNFSTNIVTDNDVITDYVFKQYKRDSTTIAYGGDHALRQGSSVQDAGNVSLPTPNAYALSICRIEPENNVHVILESFTKSELPILFIGNWQQSDYGRKLYREFQNKNNITLIKPVYCLDTLYTLRSGCSVYIHGHSAGGTNPSLVEMMHFSKPIVAYDCSFNRASMENMGDYFKSAPDLIKLLANLGSLGDGSILSEIANRRYTWDIVRKQYLEMFER